MWHTKEQWKRVGLGERRSGAGSGVRKVGGERRSGRTAVGGSGKGGGMVNGKWVW